MLVILFFHFLSMKGITGKLWQLYPSDQQVDPARSGQVCPVLSQNLQQYMYESRSVRM